MSKLQDALKALKPATDDNDSPVLQSEYDQLRAENSRMRADIAEYRQIIHSGNSGGYHIPSNAPITTSETINHLREELTHLQGQYRDAWQQIAKLRAELAEVRRDAARLDWLEQTSAKKGLSLWVITPYSDPPVWFVRESERKVDIGDGFTLREAIDSAIVQEGHV